MIAYSKLVITMGPKATEGPFIIGHRRYWLDCTEWLVFRIPGLFVSKVTRKRSSKNWAGSHESKGEVMLERMRAWPGRRGRPRYLWKSQYIVRVKTLSS